VPDHMEESGRSGEREPPADTYTQVAAPRTGYTTLGWCNLPSGGSA